MKIPVGYIDGTTGEIPCVKWHPPFRRAVSQFDSVDEPGGLWTTTENVAKHLAKVNELRREMGVPGREFSSPNEAAALIDSAAAPFDVYLPTEDGEPWRHNGVLAKSVPYGSELCPDEA